mmetsp:Transcript_6735/g.25279  ORF Transcript_6735/g.25279 Transcript_6735/m.25279 type:complete len:488 (+) Transcript_6735:101-1564(+)
MDTLPQVGEKAGGQPTARSRLARQRMSSVLSQLRRLPPQRQRCTFLRIALAVVALVFTFCLLLPERLHRRGLLSPAYSWAKPVGNKGVGRPMWRINTEHGEKITKNPIFRQTTPKSKRSLIHKLKGTYLTDEGVIEACQNMARYKMYKSSFEYSLGMLRLTQIGRPDLAVEMFDHMSGKRVEGDESSYSNGIVALEAAGQWQRAVQVLDEMQLLDMVPFKPGSEHALMAMEAGGLWQRALGFLDQLWDRGLYTPTESMYLPAIRACENGGEIERSNKLFKDMRALMKGIDITTKEAEEKDAQRPLLVGPNGEKPPLAEPAPWRAPWSLAAGAYDAPKLLKAPNETKYPWGKPQKVSAERELFEVPDFLEDEQRSPLAKRRHGPRTPASMARDTWRRDSTSKRTEQSDEKVYEYAYAGKGPRQKADGQVYEGVDARTIKTDLGFYLPSASVRHKGRLLEKLVAETEMSNDKHYGLRLGLPGHWSGQQA